MKPKFGDLVRAAFSARPLGMFVPPNWIGLGMFGVLGFLNPGFWIIGAGLELGYLGWLATHPRFQRLIMGEQRLEAERRWQARLSSLITQLEREDQRRYRLLEARCRSVLEHQLRGTAAAPGLDEQGEGLGRLAWIYLRLLLTRQSIVRIVREAESEGEAMAGIEDRLAKLQERLKDAKLGEDLRKSLSGQVEILEARLLKRREAREKLAFLDAELTRIEEQVELLREQTVLSTSPEAVSQRIDQITTTLGGTSQWIQEQQQLYGAVEDLLSEPPPITVQPTMKESQ